MDAGLVEGALPGFSRKEALGFDPARPGKQHGMGGALFFVDPLHGSAGLDFQFRRNELVVPDGHLDRLRRSLGDKKSQSPQHGDRSGFHACLLSKNKGEPELPVCPCHAPAVPGAGPLLPGRGDVRLGVDAQRVAERNVVETACGVVVVYGEAEVVGLAGSQGDVALAAAGQLAREDDDPLVALLLALGLDQTLAAFHDPLVGDVAVVLGALAGPLHQVVELAALDVAAGDIFGLLFVLGVRHRAGILVAGLPAAGKIGALDLVVLEHERQLDLVVLVHFLGPAGRLLPGEAQVEVAAVVRGLHRDGNRPGLALDRLRLDLLAGGHLLAHVGRFLVVAAGATLALLQAAGAAMLGALENPLHRRRARVEQRDLLAGRLAPVGRGQRAARTQRERQTGGGSSNQFLHGFSFPIGFQ